MRISDWVVLALEHSKMSKAELGRRLSDAVGRNVDRSMVQKMTTGTRGVTAEELLAISEITGFPHPDKEEPVVVPIDEVERVSTGGSGHDRPFHLGRYVPVLPGAIPEIDGALGAGEGIEGEIVAFSIGPETYSAHRVIEEWVVPPSVLDGQLGLAQSCTIVMRVTGDSMEPTYPAGQRVFVDTHHTALTVDAVYVISDGESAPKIKRLQRIPASEPAMVRIISDNPLFPTDTVPLDKIRIHGRVAGALVPK